MNEKPNLNIFWILIMAEKSKSKKIDLILKKGLGSKFTLLLSKLIYNGQRVSGFWEEKLFPKYFTYCWIKMTYSGIVGNFFSKYSVSMGTKMRFVEVMKDSMMYNEPTKQDACRKYDINRWWVLLQGLLLIEWFYGEWTFSSAHINLKAITIAFSGVYV